MDWYHFSAANYGTVLEQQIMIAKHDNVTLTDKDLRFLN